MVRVQAVVLALWAAGRVQGHGGLFNYSIGGVNYAGHYPWLSEDQQPETFQRRWWPDPIQDVKHPYLACNRGNPLATRIPTMHAEIKAGSNITAYYMPPDCPPNTNKPTKPSVDWPNEPPRPIPCFDNRNYPWPHGLGPLIVYMAACNGPCQDFDPSEEKSWFKIYETGFYEGIQMPGTQWEYPNNIGTHSAWDQWQFTHADGWSVEIPKNLKPGNYLIRHEIIMIELFPPQHYPACAQLTVTGDGDSLPDEEYMVSFPGAYSYDEPGLAVAGDVYSPKARETHNYTIPGPKVWTGQN